jgi:hypothetical protein
LKVRLRLRGAKLKIAALRADFGPVPERITSRLPDSPTTTLQCRQNVYHNAFVRFRSHEHVASLLIVEAGYA